MLSNQQKRHFKALAQTRKPVVIVGAKGLTQNVLDEADAAIAHHELIKIRINAHDRGSREQMIAAICAALGAELVQRIGHVAVFFRPRPD